MYHYPVYMLITCTQPCITTLCTCSSPAHSHVSLPWVLSDNGLIKIDSQANNAVMLTATPPFSLTPVYMLTTCMQPCIIPLCTCTPPAHSHVSLPCVHAHHLHTAMYHYPVYMLITCTQSCITTLCTCSSPAHSHVSLPWVLSDNGLIKIDSQANNAVMLTATPPFSPTVIDDHCISCVGYE